MGRQGVLRFFLIGGMVMAAIGFVVRQATNDLEGEAGQGGDIAGGVFIMIGVIWVAVAVLVLGWYQRVAARQAAERRLFATGKRATAVIEHVEQTATSINDLPVFVVTVRVEPDDEPPFTYRRRIPMPTSAVPIPGHLVDVAYDPADHSKVALETRGGLAIDPGQILATRAPEAERPAMADREPAPDATSPPPRPDEGLGDDEISRLERLAKLRAEGVLTETEFREQKGRILGD